MILASNTFRFIRLLLLIIIMNACFFWHAKGAFAKTVNIEWEPNVNKTFNINTDDSIRFFYSFQENVFFSKNKDAFDGCISDQFERVDQDVVFDNNMVYIFVVKDHVVPSINDQDIYFADFLQRNECKMKIRIKILGSPTANDTSSTNPPPSAPIPAPVSDGKPIDIAILVGAILGVSFVVIAVLFIRYYRTSRAKDKFKRMNDDDSSQQGKLAKAVSTIMVDDPEDNNSVHQVPRSHEFEFTSLAHSLKTIVEERESAIVSSSSTKSVKTIGSSSSSDSLNTIHARLHRFFTAMDQSKLQELDGFYGIWKDTLANPKGEAELNTVLYRSYGKDLNNFYAKKTLTGKVVILDENTRAFSTAPWLEKKSSNGKDSLKKSRFTWIPPPA